MDLNDITYKINGAIFEVNRTLGAGFMETLKNKLARITRITLLKTKAGTKNIIANGQPCHP